MSTEHSGRGDPLRSLELLWGTQKSPTRGPKPGISVEHIVQAAVAIADAEGLAALSMRRVAEKLAVGAMSLYTYIPGKAELLDLMLDSVFVEQAKPDATVSGWRAALEWRAREDWALYQRHPWVLQIGGARTWLGPNEMALYEATLHAIADVGLSGSEMMSVVSLMAGYVRGTAQSALEAALAPHQTGVSDEEWWAARAPLLEKYFDAERYPTLVRISQEGGFDAVSDGGDYLLQHALKDFAFGLQRVLDGVEAFIERRNQR